jgi:hypothetical protein
MRVQLPPSPSRPHSSAAEHQDDDLERHVRLVLRVLKRPSSKGQGHQATNLEMGVRLLLGALDDQ